MLRDAVGQVAYLRPIANRPGAGPGKLLGRRHQPSLNRVILNVIYNLGKLPIVPNQAIIALTLPKWPFKTQNSIRFKSRKSLQGLRNLRDLYPRSNQKVNMIRHHDVGVELILASMPIMNRVCDHTRDFRHPQVEWPRAGIIQEPVHRDKRLSGGFNLRKLATCRKAAMQSPCKEYRSAQAMQMRQAALGKGHVQRSVLSKERFSAAPRPIGNRPQVDNLPYNPHGGL